jgi:hypothetical protein
MESQIVSSVAITMQIANQEVKAFNVLYGCEEDYVELGDTPKSCWHAIIDNSLTGGIEDRTFPKTGDVCITLFGVEVDFQDDAQSEPELEEVRMPVEDDEEQDWMEFVFSDRVIRVEAIITTGSF